MSEAEEATTKPDALVDAREAKGQSAEPVQVAAEEGKSEDADQVGSKKAKKKKSKAKGDKEAGSAAEAKAEREYTYEQELEWCLEQLQLGLKRTGVTPEQAAESNRVIKILSSPKTPLPKKRATMHLTFGDYRKWMKKMGVEPLGDPVE